MLVYEASATGNRFPDVKRRVNELARLLIPYVRAERVRLDIALRPAQAFVFAVPHVLLTKLGYADPTFDDYLRICSASQVRNGHERAPFASLERRWIKGLWTGRKPDASWRGDLANSVLNWPLDVLGGLREDAYALTHLLMYCSDFGFRKPCLPRPRSVILNEAESLLARYLDEGDYDLVGEILLAWPFTLAPWSAAATFTFRLLAREEDRAGVLPCGNTKADRLERLQGEERVHYAFGTAYHTAYVMGFLCAACLRPNKAPPARITGCPVEPSFLEGILRHVDTKNAHWWPQFSELDQEQRRVLGPLLLDIAIVQNCRRHNYNSVAGLLSLACRHHMAKSALCAQAAQLLERLHASEMLTAKRPQRLKLAASTATLPLTEN